ncbi:4'-phosphopantetheinyl transferase [Methylorubrum rhodinum]|uniref:4'-phosphopantetheinyl transferase n=1 Tax=Methylorubrum rhodinum TaxID=29428 RepID=A0A840ZGE4_9HYPH|nr:4'-phosphopantetheinyl transferase superfamily protein [Methylorubrum rhodinum]MBB5755953.1 4'-phosphopantetheinyl transferase [Methylorubrum rhodinum]
MTGPSAEPSAPFVHTLPLTLTGRGEPLYASLALAAAPLDWLDANSEKFLHPDEAALVTDRLHARRRHGLLVGRYAAKRALAMLHPAIDPRALAIRPGVLEQPVLSGAGVRNLGVSLSHAGPVAVAVVFPEGCPMGIDLERVRADAVPLLLSQSPEAERRLAACLDGPEPERLMRLWCLKEALSKTLRCGLTVPLELLAVGSVEPHPTGLWAGFANFAQYRGLSLVAGDLAAALVLPQTVTLAPADWAAWQAALAEAAREWRE